MGHPVSVLYCEDGRAEAEAVRAGLATASLTMTPEIVGSTAEFVVFARARRHDLLLMRHRPPAFDALEALTALRRDRVDAPFVIVADPAFPLAGERALRLGADALVVASPGWQEGLAARLRDVLARRQPPAFGSTPRIRPHRALLLHDPAVDPAGWLQQVADTAPMLTIEAVAGVERALDRLAESCDFDALLAMHRPPTTDAIQFIRGVNDRRLELPVIMLGPPDDWAAAVAGFEVGAVDFIAVGAATPLELPLRVELAIERAELALANDRAATELKQRQRTLGALRESEKQLNLALEAGRVGIWTWQVGTGHTQFSRHWKAQIGYTDDEIRNDSAEWEARCHPDDLRHLKRMAGRYLAAPWPDFTVEYRMRHKDGSWRSFLLHADLETDREGRPVRMIGSQVDVTALKMQQTEMASTSARLQQLSRRLLEVQELERRHLARELHDEIGQVLTVAKMHLQSAARTPAGAGSASRVNEPVALLDRLLAQVRSLSLHLRPPLLDDLGLMPALHWLVQQPQVRSGSPRVVLSPAPGLGRFDPTTETACFRIAQEALTNALRHAQARTITLSLSASDSKLRLAVHDDGVGFDAASARQRAEKGASLGLLGMQERALLAGGTLTLLSAPGRGTEVEAVFPLSNAAESS